MDSSFHYQYCRECQVYNNAIITAFEALDQNKITRSHLMYGRYENSYVEIDTIPRLGNLLDIIKMKAAGYLESDPTSLSMGFWFNAMQPGQRTSRHSHDDFDELLSGVYYLQVPEDSGDLLLYPDRNEQVITPQSGLLVFFSPWLEHEVIPNSSEQVRLSLAFNLGPL